MTASLSTLTPHQTGPIALTLRAEGLVIAFAALAAFSQTSASWVLCAVLFFAPDLAMMAYFAGNRYGAFCYNLFHSYIGPIVLLGISMIAQTLWLAPVALVWIAHIGFDRALGYGLKYGSGFKQTHLGRV
ncbi:DUF4260 domain-containing protein [Sulfitobacter sp. F26204]|uniref:DUF4260 domain-containing protein n=1 Tax=Sulfitobacter sp. F26204 TaxID=2996014 RepID=UPI00225E3C58|nr:DUF4260 domain-containing protein [Sulfitobacter sp. F26204]MCX7559152.1 DUF4260 domain-containing protein [Sulfitobacter sp. F26204]